MSLQTWTEVLNSQIADNAISGTTSETILVPDVTISANYMYPGRTLYRSTICTLTTAASTPGTITFRHRWGGVAGIVLAASAALTPQTSLSTATIILETWFVCRAQGAGTSGSIECVGRVTNITAANAITLIPATAAAAVGVDTTTAKALSLTVQFSSSTTNATTSIIDVLESQN